MQKTHKNILKKGHQNKLSIQKIFIFTALLTLLAIPAIVGTGIFSLYRSHMIRHAVRDSQRIGETIITRYFPFMNLKNNKRPGLTTVQIATLNEDIEREISRYHMINTILKVKVYDTNNTIVYSTDNRIIGQTDPDNHFLTEALNGHRAWKTSKKGEILDLKNEHRFDVDVVSTYLPVRDHHSENISGVIELYFDISGDQQEINSVVLYTSASTFLFLLLVFGSMFYLIHRSEKAQRQTVQEQNQRLLDEEIHRHATLISIGELTASIAHQINNPIGVAMARLGYVKNKSNTFNQFGKYKEDLCMVSEQIDNIARITKRILFQSRPHTFEPIRIPVQTILDRVLPLLKLRAGNHEIEIESVVHPDSLMITGDEVFLEQIILNIANNAIDAIIEKGTPGRVSIIGYKTKEQEITFEITDNGKGIEKEDKEKIFSSFFSSKKQTSGTGLGLAIVKRLVDYHEGTIQIKSEPGVGTRFKILIPQNNINGLS